MKELIAFTIPAEELFILQEDGTYKSASGFILYQPEIDTEKIAVVASREVEVTEVSVIPEVPKAIPEVPKAKPKTYKKCRLYTTKTHCNVYLRNKNYCKQCTHNQTVLR